MILKQIEDSQIFILLYIQHFGMIEHGRHR